MTTRPRQGRLDWGHLILVAAFATFVIWYNFDAQSKSSQIENTILIVPATLVALLMCALIAGQILFAWLGDPRAEDVADQPSAERQPVIWPLLYILALGIYVWSCEMLGFDIATALFIAAGMLISGERRILPILIFSILFSVTVVYALKWALPIQIPTLFGLT